MTAVIFPVWALPAGGRCPKVALMQAGALPLNLAPGWKNVPPQATGRRLIWKRDGHWRCSDTDFAQPADLGPASSVECPMAVDPGRGRAYRYHCAQWGSRRDASELRRVNLDGSGDETLFRLGLNKWALWLCEYHAAADEVLALVATEMPSKADGTIVIQHQLGRFDLTNERSLLVNLPRDCFYPITVDLTARRALFHGAEGWQVVDFSGKRLWRLGPRGLPEGRGGAFRPGDPDELALGGGGLVLVRRNGQFESIRPCGLNPVWSPDGQTLYFAESSSDLWQWRNGQAERLLTIAGNRYAEVNRARPAVVSPDGQCLAMALTRRIRRQPIEGAIQSDGSPAWTEWSAIVVLDLAEKAVWQAPGAGPIRWAY